MPLHARWRMDYGHHRQTSLRRRRHTRRFVPSPGCNLRPLDSGGDHPWFEHGVHRRNGRECGPAGAAIGSARDRLPDVQWVVESYALFLAALLLIGGSLGDLYGRRKIFATGVVIFSAASAWCGLAPSIGQLIAAGALQGFGGALLVPGSLALISANFSEKERGRAIGTWSGFTSITAAIGPVLGGWFVRARLVAMGIFHQCSRWADRRIASSLEGPGKHAPELRASTSTGQAACWPRSVFGGIVFALIESMPLAGVAGAIALIALLYWEAHSSSPMIPLRLFRSRNFSWREPAHPFSLLRA